MGILWTVKWPRGITAKNAAIFVKIRSKICNKYAIYGAAIARKAPDMTNHIPHSKTAPSNGTIKILAMIEMGETILKK